MLHSTYGFGNNHSAQVGRSECSGISALFLTVAGYSLNGTAAVFVCIAKLRKDGLVLKKVAVIMGSDSDFPVVKDCIAELKKYGVPVEAKVMSAHRTPGLASEFASKAKAEGFGVIICAAGMAAHLAGVIAGHTTLPVIGIPIRSSFEGLDALLATVQMPSGIPVATVAVNGAKMRLFLLFRCWHFPTRSFPLSWKSPRRI